MPTYQYQCRECDRVFTERKRMSERKNTPDCPHCESERTCRKIGGSNVSCGSSSGPG